MSIELEQENLDSEWSEEYDCVPLRLRWKMLRMKVLKQGHNDLATGVPDGDAKLVYDGNFVDQKEDMNNGEKVIQNVIQSTSLIFPTTSGFISHGGSDLDPHLTSLDDTSSNSVDYYLDSDMERTSRGSGTSTSKMPSSKVFGEDKANTVVDLVHQASSKVADTVLKDCSIGLGNVLVQAGELKHETVYEFDDGLDDVVLGARKRMLISRKRIQSSGSYIEDQKFFEEMSNPPKAAKQTADIEKQDIDLIQNSEISKNLNSLTSACDHWDSKSSFDGKNHGTRLPLSVKLVASPTVTECRPFGIQETTTTNANALTNSVLPLLAKVKDEPVDTSELGNKGKSGMHDFPTNLEMMCVKSEPSPFDCAGDELDHLTLNERVKLLLSGLSKPDVDTLDNLGALTDNVDIDSVQPISLSRPIKRRKTATNSVETALEEDAPGLLKVLIERGILVDEMKLYGEEDSNDDLDDSFSEDGFTELEAVISQLFSERQTFLKFPHLRTKGAKITYCLACLLSLVEQTRFLRDKKWPVEWGWCRDLQSFIFVFHRHNRIVLERPEYGYATYFFELLNSVPSAWQIKRLVTALKLTSCGRITLMENKPLVVGNDLSEGEARVLAEYGWMPNTGLGTMLNYCDRVVHDRKQEIGRSEWRSKIGKQLMNGYNGGIIVVKNLPKKLIEDEEDPCLEEDEDEDVQVKLEQ